MTIIAKDLFSVADLTDYIKKSDPMPSTIYDSGLFPKVPTALGTRVAAVVESNGTFRVATAAAVGAPGETTERGSSKVEYIGVPHFPAQDAVSAQDTSGVRAGDLTAMQEVYAPHVTEVLRTHNQRFQITREALMAKAALKGVVTDGAGVELFNPYTKFGVAQVTFDINAAGNLQTQTNQMNRLLDDALVDDRMTGATAYCSPELFDALLEIGTFRDVFNNTGLSAAVLGADLRRKGIAFGGILWKEYNDKARNAAGTVEKLMNAGEGVLLPTGTMNTFRYFNAPPDFNETVGKPTATEFWAKMEAQPFDRGYKIHSQMNILPICLNPKAIVKLAVA